MDQARPSPEPLREEAEEKKLSRDAKEPQEEAEDLQEEAEDLIRMVTAILTLHPERPKAEAKDMALQVKAPELPLSKASITQTAAEAADLPEPKAEEPTEAGEPMAAARQTPGKAPTEPDPEAEAELEDTIMIYRTAIRPEAEAEQLSLSGKGDVYDILEKLRLHKRKKDREYRSICA